MPRKSIGERPMTDAERQARCRAARASGTPAVRIRRPLDHRSRAKRWCDAISELTTLQGHYAAWLEALPENLQDSATAEALQAICDLDLTELQAIVPPRGFGRDGPAQPSWRHRRNQQREPALTAPAPPSNSSPLTRASPSCATPTNSAGASAAVQARHNPGSLFNANP